MVGAWVAFALSCGRLRSAAATILAFRSDRYTQIMATRGKRPSDFANPPAAGEPSRLMVAAVVCLAFGALLCAASAQSVLESSQSGRSLMSSGLWQATVESLGGRINADKAADGHVTVTGQVDLSRILVPVVLLTAAAWLGGAWWISRQRRSSFIDAASKWGTLGGLWLMSAAVGNWPEWPPL